MKEIWKDIIGYEGLYSVSNTGLVKRVTTNKIKYPSLNSWGYEVVSLSKPNTKLKTILVHRLVAIHFINNPESKKQVNHIDGNKQNNCLNNLEWVTCAENAQHAIRTGLCDARTLAQSVAIIQETKDGQFVARHTSLHEAGRTTQIAWQNISKVVRGLRPFAGGFSWRYE